jgi:hypothetical protein
MDLVALSLFVFDMFSDYAPSRCLGLNPQSKLARRIGVRSRLHNKGSFV